MFAVGPYSWLTPGLVVLGVVLVAVVVGLIWRGRSSSLGYATLVANVSDRNHCISVAVTAGLFAVGGLIGYLVVWPRSRRNGSQSGTDQARVRQFGVAYGYLVAALCAVLLLIFVPLAVDNVFRAIAPGVNETSGPADGIRGFATFAVLSALTVIGLV